MVTSEIIRTFVGVPLNADVKEKLLLAQDRARGKLRDGRAVKWERDGNLHITLQFLGETPRDGLESIEEALRRAASSNAAFPLTLSTPAVFGGKRPRVLVVETGDGSDQLCQLQAKISEGLAELGFEPDHRPYSPHITIGRVRRGKKLHRKEAETALTEATSVTAGVTMQIGEFVHFESQLSPQGATYSRLATISF